MPEHNELDSFGRGIAVEGGQIVERVDAMAIEGQGVPGGRGGP